MLELGSKVEDDRDLPNIPVGTEHLFSEVPKLAEILSNEDLQLGRAEYLDLSAEFLDTPEAKGGGDS